VRFSNSLFKYSISKCVCVCVFFFFFLVRFQLLIFFFGLNFGSEWAVNIQRDSFASYIGHYPMLAYFAIAENESIGREHYNFMQVTQFLIFFVFGFICDDYLLVNGCFFSVYVRICRYGAWAYFLEHVILCHV
jgi:hypothetical protein